MSNLTDAIIAAKLIGAQGGGSGGGSGLPEIKTETVTILSEQSVAFSSTGGGLYMASIPGQYTLEAGSLITTVWEGVTYDRVIQDFGGVLAWGNIGIIGEGADTGEPFLMMYDSGNGINIMCKSSGSHTIKVVTRYQSPADGTALSVQNGAWAACGEVLPPVGITNTVLIPEDSYSFTLAQNNLYAHIFSEGLSVTEDAYTVMWDGTSYECSVFREGNEYAIGNLSLFGGGADTGEPFAITNSLGVNAVITASTAASHTVKASNTSQKPANGSVMKVVNGNWAASSIASEVMLPLTNNSPITVPAKSWRSVTAGYDPEHSNLPAGYTGGTIIGGYIMDNGTMQDVIPFNVVIDTDNQEVSGYFINTTASSISIDFPTLYGFVLA